MENRKLLPFLSAALALTVAGPLTGPIRAQEDASPPVSRPLPDRPDPREIPVPPIATTLPSLPGVDQLPTRKTMPDALTMNDGTPVTSIAQFKRRQQEMRQILEYYQVGRLPPAPGNVKGTEIKSELVMKGTVRYRLIHLTFGPEEKLSLDVGIFTPVGAGPVPAVIQPGGEPPGGPRLPVLAKGPMEGRGVDILLPPEIALEGKTPARPVAAGVAPGRGFGGFGGPVTAESLAARVALVLNHGYGYVTFSTNDCAEDTTLRLPDGSFAFRTTRFFPAYPGYDWGVIGGWVWGTMRVVDYLQTDPLVDKTKIIVTGTSRIGKAAMISGAFDDRIAMVAPGASSGLGTPAYRFSGGATTAQPSRGGKEGLTLMVMKYGNQFSPHLHEFWGQPDKLPYDAHWWAALTAPRPFLMLEGTRDPNVVHNGIRQTWLAAQSSYALFQATDKLGVYWSDRPHGFGDTDWDGLLAFADKHLLGKRVSRAFDLFPADTDATANAGTSAPAVATFNVRSFGAKGDGATKDTAAFQKALDTCAVSGGGEVIVPAGKYLIGSVQIGTHTILRLEKDSILAGSPDLADYPLVDVRWEGRWQPGRRGLIYAANVEAIGIVGPGRIEGTHTGTNTPDGTRNPVVIEPISCQNVRWDGFTVTQGGNWATHPTYCTDVEIRNVNITGSRDGIDVDSCRNVRIEGCVISTGDDSISLKSGRGMDGARLGRPCEDILISNCTLTDRSFACLGIGSEISGGIRNVRIEHCKLTSPRSYVIYIKTRIGRAGDNTNISGDDLDVLAGSFLRINLTRGGNSSTADDPVPGLLGYPSAGDLRFSNIRVACAALVQADEISALKPLHYLSLTNISGTCKKGITLANMVGAHLAKIAVTGFAGPLLSTVNVTGTGLEGAVPMPAPVDPPPGNARGGPRPPRAPGGTAPARPPGGAGTG